MLKVRSLYEVDFNLWVESQVAALGDKRFQDLDLPNLLEEIEDLARRDKKALRSHLRVLLLHLLKWQFQPSHRSKSWRTSIANARIEIEDILSDSPSLSNYLPTILEKCYESARRLAAEETELVLATFPHECPFNLAKALDPDFWPE